MLGFIAMLPFIKYIIKEQQNDGGMNQNGDIKSRIWATSYAIPAILKLSWNDILKSFPREESLVNMQVSNSLLKKENKTKNMPVKIVK